MVALDPAGARFIVPDLIKWTNENSLQKDRLRWSSDQRSHCLRHYYCTLFRNYFRYFDCVSEYFRGWTCLRDNIGDWTYVRDNFGSSADFFACRS
ncbi:hypothetical protein BH10CYA1_BH10CYA1_19250 [soil metagenome]